jgi:hypothetical protein
MMKCPFCLHENPTVIPLHSYAWVHMECTYCGARGPSRDPRKGGQIDTYCTDTAIGYWDDQQAIEALKEQYGDNKDTAQETQAQLTEIRNQLQHLLGVLKEWEESVKDEYNPDELRFILGAIVRSATNSVKTGIEDIDDVIVNLDAIAKEK